MFEQISLLREIDLFSDLSWWDLRRIAAAVKTESHLRGTVVVREGQMGTAFYVVLSGRCRIYTRTKTGQERVIGHLRHGEAFGEVALLTGEEYWASVSVSNDALLLKIDKDDFDALLHKFPKLGLKFGESMAMKLQSMKRARKYAKWSRLIAVFADSEAISSGTFSISLAASLAQESKEPVALIEFRTTPGGMVTVAELAALLAKKGQFKDRFVRHPAGYDILTITIDDDARGAELYNDLLDRLVYTFNYTILDLPPAIGQTVTRVISQADRIFYLTEGDEASVENARRTITRFQEHFSVHPADLHAVLCNMDYRARNHLSRYQERLGCPVHAALSPFPAGTAHINLDGMPYVLTHPRDRFSMIVRHLARELSNKLVGLALGVGAARGLAHIGVLRVLEQENILVDMVSGSSMGAFIAAVWCMGHSSNEMEALARRNIGSGLFRNLFDPYWLPPHGFFKGGFLKGHKALQFLRNVIGDATFADTLMPLKIAATDINKYREVIYDEGPLVDAVRASISIPGIFEPVRNGEQILVDGGILCPLPTACLVRAGVDKLIAVDTIPGPDDIPIAGKYAPRPVPEHGLSFGERLMKKFAQKVRGNAFDVIMTSTQVMEHVVARVSREEADVVLTPVIKDAAWFEFNEPAKYIECGIAEAERCLPAIKKMLTEEELEPPVELA